jgi:hypothetical protein
MWDFVIANNCITGQNVVRIKLSIRGSCGVQYSHHEMGPLVDFVVNQGFFICVISMAGPLVIKGFVAQIRPAQLVGCSHE